MPPEIFEISARNHGPGLYAEVQGAFVNKSLRDGPARAFTRSALAYRALCGRNAYGAEDSTLRQTDMFDEEADYAIGDPLTVKDGIVTTAGADGTNTVGYVTAVPYTRWANDAVAVPGMMTGALIRVLDFQCGK